MAKTRLDVLLTTRGKAPSRERAKTMIMEGLVFVNGEREDKPGASFDEEKIRSLEVRGDTMPYVGRGGLKLEKALTVWNPAIAGLTCLDIGASTGGFTDVMLQNGAKKVYAVDSGYNQLAYKLRTDDRVVCMEKTNFRYVTKADIPEEIGFAAADVSFISLTKLFSQAYALLTEGASFVCLVKPQFEAGRDRVGKKGVVRDAAVHRDVLVRVTESAVTNGFSFGGLTHSPVRGAEGNIEYLMLLKKNGFDRTDVTNQTGNNGMAETADAVVLKAHEAFRNEKREPSS